MTDLLLARALLLDDDAGNASDADNASDAGDGSDEPVRIERAAEALGVLRRSLVRFGEEDDVGNVLGGLHTAAYALARTGRKRDAAAVLTAVRRLAARRGLDPDTADPVRTAALATLLSESDMASAANVAAGADEAGMMSFLEPSPGQD
jgi:hypothetical protein